MIKDRWVKQDLIGSLFCIVLAIAGCGMLFAIFRPTPVPVPEIELAEMGQSAEGPFGAPRSSCWHTLRNKFIRANPDCGYCAKPATVVHHEHPFHLDPDRECDKTNLFPACDDCHLRRCHNGNFRDINPNIVKESAAFRRANGLPPWKRNLDFD